MTFVYEICVIIFDALTTSHKVVSVLEGLSNQEIDPCYPHLPIYVDFNWKQRQVFMTFLQFDNNTKCEYWSLKTFNFETGKKEFDVIIPPYYCEKNKQPEEFGDFLWSVASMQGFP